MGVDLADSADESKMFSEMPPIERSPSEMIDSTSGPGMSGESGCVVLG